MPFPSYLESVPDGCERGCALAADRFPDSWIPNLRNSACRLYLSVPEERLPEGSVVGRHSPTYLTSPAAEAILGCTLRALDGERCFESVHDLTDAWVFAITEDVTVTDELVTELEMVAEALEAEVDGRILGIVASIGLGRPVVIRLCRYPRYLRSRGGSMIVTVNTDPPPTWGPIIAITIDENPIRLSREWVM